MDRRLIEEALGVSIPDECIVVVNIEHLPRDTFDALREDAEVISALSGFWMANVKLAHNLYLSISTVDKAQLRSVS